VAATQQAPLFEFAVPEDLLHEALRTTGSEESIADLALVPGVGSGAPPRLRDLLAGAGSRPLLLLTIAAFLTATVETGISVLAPDIKATFHVNNAALGAASFAAAASQFVLGLPVALAADRGLRRNVAAWTMLVWAAAVPFIGLAPSIWLFALFAVLTGFGRAARDSVHLSYLSDAYPVEARARVIALHRGAEPVARTVGALMMGGIAALAGGTAGWRWSMAVGVLGVPVALAIWRITEPRKGGFESSHILDASGESQTEEEPAPKVLFGSAVQRLLRIRSLKFQLIAIAVLGFAAVGIPLFGSLFLEERFDLGPGQRALVFSIIGAAGFLGVPVAGLVGDRLYRKSPDLPLKLGGASLCAFGVLYAIGLHLPHVWMVVTLWFLAEACLAPLATAIFQTVAATAPPAMRSLAFALFGIYSLVFGGFVGGVVLGAVADAKGPAFALTLMGPVTIVGGLLLARGAQFVRRDITLTIEDTLEDHHEKQRRAGGGVRQALQVRNLDFSYGAQQVLFDVTLDVADGEMVALLGTNGAGKSTLLRAIAGLDHPERGAIRIFGARTTYLEAEQLLDLGVSMLSGGRMTFPSLTVDENLRAGSFGFRRDPAVRGGIDRVYDTFPVLRERRDQPAGTLSGGEQQMLALGRCLLRPPKLLLIDELTLGLAPMVVESLLGIVREINASGTTVVLVEQSVNLALQLAERSFFLERGELRFAGRTAELLARDDLLRPIFLGGAQ
jgi:ABC-type branched-subunit amino acid transport system ATPase component/predicted MFS family arabinose efflux permease